MGNRHGKLEIPELEGAGRGNRHDRTRGWQGGNEAIATKASRQRQGQHQRQMGIKGGPLLLFSGPASVQSQLTERPLAFALLPPTPPSGSSEIGACRPGRGRARAGLQGRLPSAWWLPHCSPGPPEAESKPEAASCPARGSPRPHSRKG